MAGDWAKAIDKNSGRTYYYNKKTKETSWTQPSDFEVEQKQVVQDKPKIVESSDLPPNWRAVVDNNSGKTYYYNKITKETSWSKPVNTTSGNHLEPTKVVEKARRRTGTISANGEWEELVDKKSGRKYWYHKKTKKTTWHAPIGLAIVNNTNTDNNNQSTPVQTDIVSTTANQPVISNTTASTNSTNVTTNTATTTTTNSNAAERLAAMKLEAKKQAVEEEKQEQTGAVSGRDNPDDAMLQLKQARNKVDLMSMLEDDDDDEDDIDGFDFAKHRHGFLARTFRVGKIFDTEKLLSFKKSMIHKSLLKRNRHLDKECVQAFKNVMSYMGDRSTTKKDNMAHALKLLRNAMTHPAGLRDEIYLQLCKQTTGNPKADSVRKGWELFTFCLACFPPSKQLKKFLLSYFQETINSPDTADTIRKFATDCVERMQKIIVMQQRKLLPSRMELECMREQRDCVIKVYLVNGHKAFQVDSYTLISELEEKIYEKLSLTLTTPFALYQAHSEQPNLEELCEPKDRVLDVMASWERYAHLTEDGQEKSSDKKEKKKKKLVDESAGSLKSINFDHFLYKAKLVLKTNDPDVIADPESVSLLYLQAIRDIVTERYPAKTEDIQILAALQLQATFGDYKPEAHGEGWLISKLGDFMPAKLFQDAKGRLNQQTCNEWEQKILDKYKKIGGFTALEAKLNYLDYVQEWPFYGATFFTVEQRQFKDYPSPLTLGLTCEGVILMHPKKRTLLENFPYTDIVTWGHSDERFIVVVGNIVQQRKLIFKTSQGSQMNNLIHDYVKFKVKNKV